VPDLTLDTMHDRRRELPPAAAVREARDARLTVLRGDAELARRQLEGFESAIRVGGQVIGMQVHPPAEGAYRAQLNAELGRLEARIARLEHGFLASAVPVTSSGPVSATRVRPAGGSPGSGHRADGPDDGEKDR
jgi:hypothetical protein